MDERIDEKRPLPVNTVLKDRYEISMVLGEGGFAITYLAKDKDGKNVTVKEYFPSSFAVRKSDEAANLHIFDETMGKFDKGKLRFVKEAGLLSQFQHLDGIQTVYDCFEENNTAYIVMEYIEGITLLEYVEEQGVLSYNELVSLLSPIMRALIQIHRHGIIHRDISPDNIIIGLDNKARIIDFGAAGIINDNKEEADGAIGKTVILKTGYAPPEQYTEGGKQGAWTDVYGMAATIYMGLTGKAPLDTVKRLQMGEEKSNKAIYNILTNAVYDNKVRGAAVIRPWQAMAVITGISLSLDRRYGDMGELYEALTVPPSIEKNVTILKSSDRKVRSGKAAFIVAAVSLTMVLVLSIIVAMLIIGGNNGQSIHTENNNSISTQSELTKEAEKTYKET